jgi:hypothetical protein
VLGVYREADHPSSISFSYHIPTLKTPYTLLPSRWPGTNVPFIDLDFRLALPTPR